VVAALLLYGTVARQDKGPSGATVEVEATKMSGRGPLAGGAWGISHTPDSWATASLRRATIALEPLIRPLRAASLPYPDPRPRPWPPSSAATNAPAAPSAVALTNDELRLPLPRAY
jgi:hypothetical protein